MAITVNIIIKGVAICYKKRIDGKDFWRVLFPFDNENLNKPKGICHKLNFTWKKDDEPNLPVPPLHPTQTQISLAKSRGLITINAPQASGNSGETDSFRKFVFDLTNKTDSTKPITHNNIVLKNVPADEWRRGTVLMKIDAPATFSVDVYLNDLLTPNDPIELNEDDKDGNEVGGRRPTFPIMAHSLKATIQLNDTGTLTVNDGSTDIVVVSGSGVYTLVFDNDCKEKKPNKNDMDMFYAKTIADDLHPKRKFRIGKRAKSGTKSIPPEPEKGKPCLVVDASQSDNLPADAAP